MLFPGKITKTKRIFFSFQKTCAFPLRWDMFESHDTFSMRCRSSCLVSGRRSTVKYKMSRQKVHVESWLKFVHRRLQLSQSHRERQRVATSVQPLPPFMETAFHFSSSEKKTHKHNQPICPHGLEGLLSWQIIKGKPLSKLQRVLTNILNKSTC